MMKKILLSIYVFSCLFTHGENRKIEWVVTTPDVSWQTQDAGIIDVAGNGKPDAEIEINNPQQSIDGFGACFNELGWTSLSLLNENDRNSIFRELFESGQGANFTICRMPLGANDFSRDWYSYNETDGDFEMINFSIANDRETLIPFIKAAQKYKPDLKIWASPWSPPVWMKENKHYACKPLDTSFFDSIGQNGIRPEQVRREGVNMFIQDEAYFSAYALYFRKFIEAYRTENINIYMVMPQNEFNSCQPFPSCTWTASGLATFIGKYLGPSMQSINVELMFGTMERPNPALVDTILKDAESGRYITGVGFQWAGKKSVGDIHRRYPHLKIYQTEQECGNGKNNWEGCVYSWKLMQHFLNNGTNVYDYWNISLEEGGLSRWGWRQNSLVTVDRKNKTYKFTYEYYLMKHVSHYVLPGARFLPVSGEFTDIAAFRNTDNSYVLIIHNTNDTEIKPSIKIGNQTISLPLKPQSFNTIVLK
ncbi:MAG: beta-glycosidase [Tannerella sp.]|jgi:glucosylceramidase|nr:beta-glycosidase [Tannerella sp.]